MDELHYTIACAAAAVALRSLETVRKVNTAESYANI